MLPQQILYRKAGETDCADCVWLHYAAVHALASGHYPGEVIAAWSPAPDAARYSWFAGVIAQAAVLCTVAEAPDRMLVGFSIAAPEQALLRAIYIHPAFTGSGIGEAWLWDLAAYIEEFDSLTRLSPAHMRRGRRLQ